MSNQSEKEAKKKLRVNVKARLIDKRTQEEHKDYEVILDNSQILITNIDELEDLPLKFKIEPKHEMPKVDVPPKRAQFSIQEDNKSSTASSIYQSNILETGFIRFQNHSTPARSNFFDPNDASSPKGVRSKRFVFKIPAITAGDTKKKVIRTKVTLNLKNLMKNTKFGSSDTTPGMAVSESDVEPLRKISKKVMIVPSNESIAQQKVGFKNRSSVELYPYETAPLNEDSFEIDPRSSVANKRESKRTSKGRHMAMDFIVDTSNTSVLNISNPVGSDSENSEFSMKSINCVSEASWKHSLYTFKDVAVSDININKARAGGLKQQDTVTLTSIEVASVLDMLNDSEIWDEAKTYAESNYENAISCTDFEKGERKTWTSEEIQALNQVYDKKDEDSSNSPTFATEPRKTLTQKEVRQLSLFYDGKCIETSDESFKTPTNESVRSDETKYEDVGSTESSIVEKERQKSLTPKEIEEMNNFYDKMDQLKDDNLFPTHRHFARNADETFPLYSVFRPTSSHDFFDKTASKFDQNNVKIWESEDFRSNTEIASSKTSNEVTRQECQDSSVLSNQLATVRSSLLRLEDALEHSIKVIADTNFQAASLESAVVSFDEKDAIPTTQQRRRPSVSFSQVPAFSSTPIHSDDKSINYEELSQFIGQTDTAIVESIIRIAQTWKNLKEKIIADRLKVKSYEDILTENELLTTFAEIVKQIIGRPSEMKATSIIRESLEIMSSESLKADIMSTETLSASSGERSKFDHDQDVISLRKLSRELEQSIGSKSSSRRRSSTKSTMNLYHPSEESFPSSSARLSKILQLSDSQVKILADIIADNLRKGRKCSMHSKTSTQFMEQGFKELKQSLQDMKTQIQRISSFSTEVNITHESLVNDMEVPEQLIADSIDQARRIVNELEQHNIVNQTEEEEPVSDDDKK